MTLDKIKRATEIIEEMLTPILLAPDYPLSFTNAKPYLWSEIPEEDKTVIGERSVSTKHTSYNWKLKNYRT